MFNIDFNAEENVVYLEGKFDASRTKIASEIFNKLESSSTVDMKDLDYISSAGIGILVATYKRLKDKGQELYLRNLNSHIKEVFQISLLDRVFIIQ